MLFSGLHAVSAWAVKHSLAVPQRAQQARFIKFMSYPRGILPEELRHRHGLKSTVRPHHGWRGSRY
ncbi:hypothetical protein COO59_19435 [Mixta theicola]|uniref:Uncharacterized protein n=1 Tax=Mixta theicola TaxID=1458355 RepID=A0A2K1Q4W4_9GAMM|nr:hypothetical protein COO59_19435 [Mixta theicola]